MVSIFHLPDLEGGDESLAGKPTFPILSGSRGVLANFFENHYDSGLKVRLIHTRQDFDAQELNLFAQY